MTGNAYLPGMRIGILSRGPRLYSTQSLWKAAQRRGHEVHVYDHTQCHLVLRDDKPNVYHYEHSLHHLDAVIPRIGASVTAVGAAVINQFEVMGVLTTTSSDALLRARDKWRCLQQLAQHKIPIPRTVLLGSRPNFYQQVHRMGGLPVVIKLLESTHGDGVILAEYFAALQSTVEALHEVGERVLLQEFVEEARGSDIRALVVDGDIVAVMRRTAPPGEFRSNLHRGAVGECIELDAAAQELVKSVVDIMDLRVAGVDLLPSDRGYLVMEVNASPGLEGIERVTGVDVAGKIIEMVERMELAGKKR